MSHQAEAPRGRGRIALVVLLVLLLAAALVAAILLVPRDGDDSDADPDGGATRPPGRVLDGHGYAYSLPDRWHDLTEEALANNLPKTVDTVSGLGKSYGTTLATVFVERFRVKPGTSLDDLEKSWERNLAPRKKPKPTHLPSVDIDGEQAVGRQVRASLPGGDAIVQIAYLVVHDGYGYSIGLNSRASDTSSGSAFDDVISSWVWDD